MFVFMHFSACVCVYLFERMAVVFVIRSDPTLSKSFILCQQKRRRKRLKQSGLLRQCC